MQPPADSLRSDAALSQKECERLDTLYVTLPNYVRIVYDYVPVWAQKKPCVCDADLGSANPNQNFPFPEPPWPDRPVKARS